MNTPAARPIAAPTPAPSADARFDEGEVIAFEEAA